MKIFIHLGLFLALVLTVGAVHAADDWTLYEVDLSKIQVGRDVGIAEVEVVSGFKGEWPRPDALEFRQYIEGGANGAPQLWRTRTFDLGDGECPEGYQNLGVAKGPLGNGDRNTCHNGKDIRFAPHKGAAWDKMEERVQGAYDRCVGPNAFTSWSCGAALSGDLWSENLLFQVRYGVNVIEYIEKAQNNSAKFDPEWTTKMVNFEFTLSEEEFFSRPPYTGRQINSDGTANVIPDEGVNSGGTRESVDLTSLTGRALFDHYDGDGSESLDQNELNTAVSDWVLGSITEDQFDFVSSGIVPDEGSGTTDSFDRIELDIPGQNDGYVQNINGTSLFEDLNANDQWDFADCVILAQHVDDSEFRANVSVFDFNNDGRLSRQDAEACTDQLIGVINAGDRAALGNPERYENGDIAVSKSVWRTVVDAIKRWFQIG